VFFSSILCEAWIGEDESGAAHRLGDVAKRQLWRRQQLVDLRKQSEKQCQNDQAQKR